MKASWFLIILCMVVQACKEETPPLVPITNPPVHQNPPCRIQFIENRSGTETTFEHIYYDSTSISRVNVLSLGAWDIHFYHINPLQFKYYFVDPALGADTTGRLHIEVEKLPNGRLARIFYPLQQNETIFTHHPSDSVYISVNGQPDATSFFDGRGNETYQRKIRSSNGQLHIEEQFMTYDNAVNPFSQLGYDYWLYLGQSRNNLQKVVTKVNGTTVKEQHFLLEYDNSGRLTAMTDTLNNNYSVRLSYYPCP